MATQDSMNEAEAAIGVVRAICVWRHRLVSRIALPPVAEGVVRQVCVPWEPHRRAGFPIQMVTACTLPPVTEGVEKGALRNLDRDAPSELILVPAIAARWESIRVWMGQLCGSHRLTDTDKDYEGDKYDRRADCDVSRTRLEGLTKSKAAKPACKGATTFFRKSAIRKRNVFIRQLAPAGLQHWRRLLALTPG